ncbi:MAG: response regulator, partial [Pseudomonadota bacterium]|nr:response regulator [Pseudomonadota bacterium]
ESVGTLAGGIAHQFNNALCVITGNIDLLEMNLPGDENVIDCAKEVKDSVTRMTQLTSQLLAYAGGGKYQVATVSLSDFVRDTLPLVRPVVDPAIKIDSDLPRDILAVEIDPAQLQMVLSAVLINASEALEGKGHIRVACRNIIITDETGKDFPGLKSGEHVCLTITDDGRGMDGETLKRIFEPFFSSKFQGRGLGMAAVYGIVKNHDGWITVDSEPGRGTVVKIYLPAARVQVREPEKPKSERIEKGTGTILVVEDEEMVIAVYQSILEELGYHVLAAKTGREALDIVKVYDGDIDLVLLDIMLPDINGNVLYPLLMEARSDLKVIVCSGYSIDGPAQGILDAGAQEFIQKPFTIEELSGKLKKVIAG